MTTIPQTPLHIQTTNLKCPEAPRKKKRRFNNYRELPTPLRLNFDNEVNFLQNLNFEQNFEDSMNFYSSPLSSPRENNIRVCPDAPVKGNRNQNIFVGITRVNLFGIN